MSDSTAGAVQFKVVAIGHSTYIFKVFRPINLMENLIRRIRSVEGVLYEVARAESDAVLVEYAPERDKDQLHITVIDAIASHIGLSNEELERLMISLYRLREHMVDVPFKDYRMFPASGML